MMVVEVETEPAFKVGRPTPLFEEPYEIDPYGGVNPNYDVSRDGQQFLMVRSSGSETADLIVIQNWFEELKERVPVN